MAGVIWLEPVWLEYIVHVWLEPVWLEYMYGWSTCMARVGVWLESVLLESVWL